MCLSVDICMLRYLHLFLRTKTSSQSHYITCKLIHTYMYLRTICIRHVNTMCLVYLCHRILSCSRCRMKTSSQFHYWCRAFLGWRLFIAIRYTYIVFIYKPSLMIFDVCKYVSAAVRRHIEQGAARWAPTEDRQQAKTMWANRQVRRLLILYYIVLYYIYSHLSSLRHCRPKCKWFPFRRLNLSPHTVLYCMPHIYADHFGRTNSSPAYNCTAFV